jgi:hypothetical protein
MYHPTQQHYTPNKPIVRIGLLSAVLHVLILLIMFYNSKYNYISYNMSRHDWFNGSISMLLLIEHAVWIHLLWSLARYPYYNLVICCLGTFALVFAWIMQIVVPVHRDPHQHHLIYAVIFGIACTVNLFASLTILPNDCTDQSYKYTAAILGTLAALAGIAFVIVKVLRNDPQSTIDWHTEPSLQMLAYTAYITALAVCLEYWGKKN